MRRRQPELVLEWVFRPLGRPLVSALARMRVSPVAVVLANGVAGLGAALAIARGQLVAGALLLQLRTLLDNADGQLARTSGRTSALGRYLDTEVDLVVNAVVFAALARETSSPLLALAAFLALTLVLSADFDYDVLYRRTRGEDVVVQPDASGEGALARALERVYRFVFGPQDRALQRLSERRLERLLAGVADAEERRRGTLAYYDDTTGSILANLGLSTQLAILGLCLVLDAPVVYLWLVVGFAALLPLLQLRRELLVRRWLRGSERAA
jgi:phosphatidylglycerophosphate synthase